MRVTTLFKRLLHLDGVRVVAVELDGEPGRERVIVDLERPTRRRLCCPRCGFRTRAVYDRSLRTLRHLDLLRTPCFLRLEVRRLHCPACGVVAEELPFARVGSRFTRAFEDTCVWLVRDAPKTVVSRLMRIDWATVGRMLERVVAEASAGGEDWLAGLRRIGIDEVSYRKGRRYLLCVVCHDTGRIVWAAPGKSRAVLNAFFDELGEERCARLEAVSADMHGAWAEVIHARARNALVCTDPFHVVRAAGEALETLRRQDWQRLRKEDPERAVWLKGTRFVLRRRAGSLSEGERTLVEELAATNERVYRGWLLVDQLRAVYQAADAQEATLLLDEWLRAARASVLVPFVRVARTLAEHREGIVNAIALGLSNARLEAMNSTVRLISHRSRGFRRLESLLAMIRLVCGKIPVTLPT
jgi:transposase